MCSKDGAWALARYTGAGVKTLAGGASFYSFARLLLPHPAITGVVTLVLSIGNFMAQTAVLQDSKSAKTSENTTPLLAAATADKLTEELEEPRRTA
ncbi:MAG: hypothetical protein COU68_03355 [Candidatus Pacebacteria bacterium CG10_big_fil_rev_8_21_14_0_10_45_6]|nr:MAG: hypothetical protein COU68_03355 [Candidatus Pacebacteria bacterium CG10_big_fil_rev_8_21_14_0_10_45_6]